MPDTIRKTVTETVVDFTPKPVTEDDMIPWEHDTNQNNKRVETRLRADKQTFLDGANKSPQFRPGSVRNPADLATPARNHDGVSQEAANARAAGEDLAQHVVADSRAKAGMWGQEKAQEKPSGVWGKPLSEQAATTSDLLGNDSKPDAVDTTSQTGGGS